MSSEPVIAAPMSPPVVLRTGTLRPSEEVCESIRMEAFTGLKALPRRGAEIGGMLLQKAGPGDSDAEPAAIGDFELFACEHLYGPSFRLSPKDGAGFRARCRELNEQPGCRVAGIFRSSTRESFEPTPEETTLAGEVAGESGIVLLVRPSLSGNSVFRIFSREGGIWLAVDEFEVLGKLPANPPPQAQPAPRPPAVRPVETEVRRTELRRTELDPTELHRTELHRAELHRTTPLDLAISDFRPAEARRVLPARLLWLGGAAVCVALLLYSGMRRTSAPAGGGNAPDLAMQVVQQGEILRLTWNRNLPAVRNAAGGILHISDGEKTRDVRLDAAQVSQGSIFYSPGSDDVTFRLTIESGEALQVAGFARVLGGGKHSATAESQLPPEFPTREASASRPQRQPEARQAAASLPPNRFANGVRPPAPIRPSAPASAAGATDIPATAGSESRTSERRGEATEIPPRTLATAPPGATVIPSINPPEGRGAPEKSPAPRNEEGTRSASAVPAGGPREVSGTERPGTEATVTEQPATRTPLITSTPLEAPVPAQPLWKVLPVVKIGSGAPSILTPMTITISVSIDKRGFVTSAKALPGQSNYWSGKAIEAARQWRFRPATLHGQNVPSSSTIDFRFNPPLNGGR